MWMKVSGPQSNGTCFGCLILYFSTKSQHMYKHLAFRFAPWHVPVCPLPFLSSNPASTSPKHSAKSTSLLCRAAAFVVWPWLYRLSRDCPGSTATAVRSQPFCGRAHSYSVDVCHTHIAKWHLPFDVGRSPISWILVEEETTVPLREIEMLCACFPSFLDLRHRHIPWPPQSL